VRYRAVSSLATGVLAAALAGCSVIHEGQGHASAPELSGSPPSTAPIPAPATVDDNGQPVSPVALRLVREIYLAAAGADYPQLRHLLTRACFHSTAGYNAQIQLWHQPGTLHEMTTVLLTHGAATDGYTYPGFALSGWHTRFDYQDSAALHVVAPPSPTSDASSYTGPRIVVSFAPATGSKPNWCGLTPGG
jgi:hypothetical protein